MNIGTFYRGEIKPIVLLDVLLFLLAVVSAGLNGGLLFLTYRRKPIDTILMAIIASLDLISALCVIVGSIWKWTVGYSVLEDGSAWCHVNSLVGWSVTISALNVMAVLSLVRYLTIVRGKEIHNSTVILLSVMIIASFTLLFGVKQIVNKPVAFTSGMYCAAVWSDGTPLSSTLSILIWILALPPIFIIPLCYARVTSFYTALVLRQSEERLPRKLYRQRQSLILVILCYIMTLLPEYTQAFVSVIFKLELISWVDGLCKILVFMVTIVNPIFAIHSHSGIRDQVQDMFDPFYG